MTTRAPADVKITVPVLLMVFNRPEKTREAFEAVREARPRKLYVAADGPRSHVPADQDKCAKVREIVARVDWDCEAKYLFHEQNLGCSLAGKTAWDWVFSREDELIFIEDDGLASRSFFWFCQELLRLYRDDARIAYIGGVNYGPKYGRATYYFSRLPAATYAMATWKRVHALYEFHLDSYSNVRNTASFRAKFLNRFAFDYHRAQFNRFVARGGNTYDIQMIYLVHKHGMYSVVPNTNMASNIGLDYGGANNDVNPHGTAARRLGNRPRFEIQEIVHPDGVSIDAEFEKAYFRVRVLHGASWVVSVLRFYALRYAGRAYRILVKGPFRVIGGSK